MFWLRGIRTVSAVQEDEYDLRRMPKVLLPLVVSSFDQTAIRLLVILLNDLWQVHIGFPPLVSPGAVHFNSQGQEREYQLREKVLSNTHQTLLPSSRTVCEGK